MIERTKKNRNKYRRIERKKFQRMKEIVNTRLTEKERKKE
jgi:hypothetical protein